ncbi:MAG TPA: M14 family zinc carboxypeptidase, partial [Candidatus Hydrogenedentes bacterium]|nr:M14 family zinc carboxypeptidase [Candidatus Hydrogenedentota bacterium]
MKRCMFLLLLPTLALCSFSAYGAQARPGRIAVLEAPVTTSAVAQALQAWDFDVDRGPRPGVVRVYATDEEVRLLDQLGIAYKVTGYQPDPPDFGPFDKSLGTYHSYAEIAAMLEGYAAAHPNICRLQSAGNSHLGRTLWVLLITDNPDIEENEPEFKYISTIHGDEPVGTEMCLYFIDLLLNAYGTESTEGQRLTWLVDNTAIYVMPLMNPDGHVAGSRYNAQGYDLNRNFPSYILDDADGNIFDGDPFDAAGRPTEVQRVMEWTASRSFTLSANFHTGAVVVNYPFDEDNVPINTYAPTPDDELFIHMSKQYSIYNSPMWNSTSFLYGITNGSDWYTIYGGMQDWNYRYVSCNDVTIELAVPKKPSASALPTYWTNNKESMLSYLEQVHKGVRGIVTDAVTAAPVYAKVEVQGNAHAVYTDPAVGNYHRLLLPGTYTLSFSAPDYVSQTVDGVVVASGLRHGSMSHLCRWAKVKVKVKVKARVRVRVRV